uniref:Putative secreted protein n=1 Tax=Ixodes scapularis TaxID=6945 RepID=A0A4D5RC63_IXOSC
MGSLPNRPLWLFLPAVVLPFPRSLLLISPLPRRHQLARIRKSVFSSFFFFKLRFTFVHNGGTCDRHSTKAKHEASHWPRVLNTKHEAKKGEHATPSTLWSPRKNSIPQRTPEWRETNYCWFKASSEHDLVARSPREERPKSSPKSLSSTVV